MVWFNTEKVCRGWNHETQRAYQDLTKTTISSLILTKALLLPKPNHRRDSGCESQSLESKSCTLYTLFIETNVACEHTNADLTQTQYTQQDVKGTAVNYI